MHLCLHHRVDWGTKIQEYAADLPLKMKAALFWQGSAMPKLPIVGQSLLPQIHHGSQLIKLYHLWYKLLSPYGPALGHVHIRRISTAHATTKKCDRCIYKKASKKKIEQICNSKILLRQTCFFTCLFNLK